MNEKRYLQIYPISWWNYIYTLVSQTCTR